ncbi:MAG: hypothetical protein CL670_14895 [Balneola sp.]|jgi:hypothetical protein|nr:hypothetical protein [Balneola sp.]MBE80444.1 hypothetical protein [Balneola sp.]HAD51287.1 hypothetical protein [Algoriphagus sp.]|tara:strand:- start:1559 stop:2011 length:453 start_codon:yes stop_codon:yes gene_type:complete
MKNLVLLLLFVLSTSTSVISQNLQDLNWISGYWTGNTQGVAMEELWTPVAGNMILGVHRDVVGENSGFEFLRITTKDDGTIVYLASPSGKEPTEFTLSELTSEKVVFENLSHDFPQRIIYSRAGDKLTARIEDESGEKGMQWSWTKMELK